MKSLIVALSLFLSASAFGDCRRLLDELAITMTDRELWHDGAARGPTEKLLDGFGCDGVVLSNVKTHAETAGGARVRVTWEFEIENESAVRQKPLVRFTVKFGDVERSGTFSGTIEPGETITTRRADFLIPETELRIGKPSLRVIVMAEAARE